MTFRTRARPRGRLLTDLGAQVVGWAAWAVIAAAVVACIVIGKAG